MGAKDECRSVRQVRVTGGAEKQVIALVQSGRLAPYVQTEQARGQLGWQDRPHPHVRSFDNHQLHGMLISLQLQHAGELVTSGVFIGQVKGGGFIPVVAAEY